MAQLGAQLIKDGTLTTGQLGKKTESRVTSGRYMTLCVSLLRACCEPKQSVLIFLPGTNFLLIKAEVHTHTHTHNNNNNNNNNIKTTTTKKNLK